MLFFLFAPAALQNQSPKSCHRAPPRKFWALEPPANLLCSPSLSVHGSVLSLASSASSTYSSVRPLKSLPFQPPPQPFHIPADFLWLGNWMGIGNYHPCILLCGSGTESKGRHLVLGAPRRVPRVLSVLSGLAINSQATLVFSHSPL